MCQKKIDFLHRIVLLVTLTLLPFVGMKAEKSGADSIRMGELFNTTIFKPNSKDSLTRERHKKTFFHRVGNVFTGFFREFNNTDSNFIEPQHYNFAVMLQNTNTYELYTLSSKDGMSITLAPNVSYRLGPYFGWRWIFLGYTVDLSGIGLGSEHKSKKEFNVSLYSNMLGFDLFWRETGNNYHVRKLYLGDDVDTSPMKGAEFGGLNASIKGFNLYYIFNHRKFSYPAAYSQSSVQRKSAGSLLLGIGYTRHTLDVDWSNFSQLVKDKLDIEIDDDDIRNQMTESTVKYDDFSCSCGYTYNWVFAHNWLFNASLSAALGYKHSSASVESNEGSVTKRQNEFDFNNFNIDGIGRFALVWNNTCWYAGASCIIHSYNYKKNQFSTNNSFGSLNIYFGLNFGRKRE